MDKKEVIKKFGISGTEIKILDKYILELKKTNKLFNLVGRSTLLKVWDRHIADSLQITQLIKNKNSTILDMGTGAGLPGLVLAICGYRNITMIDSKTKKIEFLKNVIKKLNLEAATISNRIENTKLKPFEYITSRAMAPLSELLNYSLLFSNKNTTLVFLKGRNVNIEIIQAKKTFSFSYKIFKSLSCGKGNMIKINSLKKND